jgi:membrane protein
LTKATLTIRLAALLGGDFLAALAHRAMHEDLLAAGVSITSRVIGWFVATVLLALAFAVIYYRAPKVKAGFWHWLKRRGAIGIAGWLLCSLGLRVWLHYIPSYSLTYGSLGAVIILLTWFLHHRPHAASRRRDQQ